MRSTREWQAVQERAQARWPTGGIYSDSSLDDGLINRGVVSLVVLGRAFDR